ncbi:rhodanese-like domain-containing protein [Aneurinibacillus terranovensis]|uniref:rhodanese-like domain-containing protein n=1 Tax=Aneurinibacillus terranovensis TaxID=278991 RepID=UPI000413748C|nr:rhodanese-like domain-containing protein [Aneurinibacillus terranovensis]
MEPLSITPQEFAQKYNDNELKHDIILDVREPYEWDAYHLEDATHLPMKDIPENLDQLDKKKTIYVMCAHGVRSWHVQQYLLTNGFDKVVNVEGGIAAVAYYMKE